VRQDETKRDAWARLLLLPLLLPLLAQVSGGQCHQRRNVPRALGQGNSFKAGHGPSTTSRLKPQRPLTFTSQRQPKLRTATHSMHTCTQGRHEARRLACSACARGRGREGSRSERIVGRGLSLSSQGKVNARHTRMAAPTSWRLPHKSPASAHFSFHSSPPTRPA
jgi:hypothetical protein